MTSLKGIAAALLAALFLSLCAVVWWQSSRLDHAASQAAEQARSLNEMRAAVADHSTALADLSNKAAAAVQDSARLNDSLQTIQLTQQNQFKTLEELRRHDPKIHDWLNLPVPADINGLLNEQPAATSADH